MTETLTKTAIADFGLQPKDSQDKDDFGASKCEEVSQEMLVLSFQHVLSGFSRFSAVLVASPCLWRSCKTSHIERFQTFSNEVKMPFCVASVARLDILTCLIKCQK